MNTYNEGDRINTVIHGIPGTVVRKLGRDHYKVQLDREMILGWSSGLRLKTLNFFSWEIEGEKVR